MLASVLSISTAAAGGVSARAEDTADDKVGVIPSKQYSLPICDTADYLQAVRLTADSQEEVKTVSAAIKNYVSSVDNSTDPYFPEIESQGGIGSCGAWANVYYTFTHEMNRSLGRTTTPENTFQPLFIYNFMVGGHADWGTVPVHLVDMLTHTGCPTYQSVPDTLDASSWNASFDIWREANDYRVSSYMYFVNVGNRSSRITSPTDTDLDSLKAALRSGHVLSVGAYIYSFKYDKLKACATDASINQGHVGENVVTKTLGYDGYHGMTLVGYDDNIWTDINGNNRVDEGEMGAFKIANSWGKTYQNKGFVWVAYDSLNTQSVVEGVGFEENRPMTMNSYLMQNISKNKKSSQIYLKYTLNSDNRHDSYLEITATRKTDGMKYTKRTAPYYIVTEQGDRYNLNYMGKEGFGDGTMIFDLDNIIYDLNSDNFNDYRWSVKVVDVGGDSSSLTVRDISVVDENAAKTYPLDAALPFTVNNEEKEFGLKKCYQFNSMSITPNSHATVKNPVKITVKAENETRQSDPIKYQVVITRGTKIVYTKSFKASSYDKEKGTATASVKWTPTVKGNYTATVTSTDATGAIARRSMDFQVYPEDLTVRSVNFNTDTHIGNYEQVKITPLVTGGTAPYTYSYYYTKGGKTYPIAENTKYSSKTKSFGINTGTYKITVQVRDAAGKTASLSRSLVVDRTRIYALEFSDDYVEVGKYTWIYGKVTKLASTMKDAQFIYTVTKDGKTVELPIRDDHITYWYPQQNGVHTVTLTIKYKGQVVATQSVDYEVGALSSHSTTQKIAVNVISYVCNETNANNFTVRYWGGKDGAKDVKCTALNTTTSYSVGNAYWGGAKQTFRQFVAEIPKDATGYKFHIGDRWFGGDGKTGTSNTVYIFNYDGDKALYTKQ